jgi:aubergine-like protein
MKFMTVVTSYGKEKKTYQIERVDFDQSPDSKFPQKDGNEISFMEYYRNQYNIDIKEPS